MSFIKLYSKSETNIKVECEKCKRKCRKIVVQPYNRPQKRCFNVVKLDTSMDRAAG